MKTSLEVTKLSSKGQVVLPLAVRERLHLNEGMKFVVLGEGDTIILKIIEMPTLERAKKLAKESRAYAKRSGLKKSDVRAAVKHSRARK